MSELKQETINKLIKDVVSGAGIDKEKEDWLYNEIAELVNKVQFSDNYCPECVERMFWKNGGFVCPKCGKTQKVILTKIESPAPVIPEPKFEARPVNKRKAATILELRNRMDGGAPVTPQPGGETLPGAASKEINWV